MGVGYDCGHHTREEILADWTPHLGRGPAEELTRASGKHGARAKALLPSLRHLWIGPDAARAVLESRSLPKYARQTPQAFPGVEDLPPDAQGGLLSLVYNRGASMRGDSRREMREIARILASDRVLPDKLRAIAGQVRAMKRLWERKGLPGLLRRRDEEADLIARAVFHPPGKFAPPRSRPAAGGRARPRAPARRPDPPPLPRVVLRRASPAASGGQMSEPDDFRFYAGTFALSAAFWLVAFAVGVALFKYFGWL